MSELERRLNLVLEDSAATVGAAAYSATKQATDERLEAMRRLTTAEAVYSRALDRLCGSLALAVKRQIPGVSASLGDHNCQINYHSREMTFSPDLDTEIWSVEASNPAVARRFVRLYGSAVQLQDDLEPMAAAIASFYRDHYKTLGEDTDADVCLEYGDWFATRPLVAASPSTTTNKPSGIIAERCDRPTKAQASIDPPVGRAGRARYGDWPGMAIGGPR